METTEAATLVINREIDDKMRVTSMLWPDAKVIRRRGEVLEVHFFSALLFGGYALFLR